MKRMEVYLCRHGETEWTLVGKHTGGSDIPLTEHGKEQAIQLGHRLRALPKPLVICSPRKRALQTCQLAGFDLAHVMIDADAQEWDYGNYEGKTNEQIQREHPGWSLFQDGAPGGESAQDIGHRADRLLQKIAKLQKSVALFSHGHFSRVFAARWLQLEPDAGRYFYLSVASLSILGWEREEAPVLKLWNECD